jgi:hypothetical protein
MTAARPTHGGRRRVVAIALALYASTAIATAQDRRTDLDGVWILASSAKFENLELTPAGEAARGKYDYLTNDPGMQCIPASITRVMHTPSPPIEIRQHADHVEINYEFMDVHRRVPLKPGLAASSAPYAAAAHRHLGRSVARYDGAALIVETEDIGAGVHDTLGMPGLPQSNQMRTVERFTASGNRMEIAVTHRDSVFYTRPYTATFSYLRLPDGKILPWGCTPEEADYKRFLPSAAPK